MLGFGNTLRHPRDDDRNLAHRNSGQGPRDRGVLQHIVMSIIHKENRMWQGEGVVKPARSALLGRMFGLVKGHAFDCRLEQVQRALRLMKFKRRTF